MSLSLLLAVFGVGLLVVPTHHHAGPSGLYFFDCGSALDPTPYPDEPNAREACARTNGAWRTAAFVAWTSAVVLQAAALALVVRMSLLSRRAGTGGQPA